MLPKDPYILLSYLNTQLRDNYPSLEEFCAANDQSREERFSRRMAQASAWQNGADVL